MRLNVVTLGGNITRDPQLRHLPQGSSVAEFGLAINERYGELEKTVFVDIACFGKTAEFVNQYLKKGRAIVLVGSLKYDSWEDKTSGVKRNKLSVVAHQIQFADGKRSDDGDQDAPAEERQEKPAARTQQRAASQPARASKQSPLDEEPQFKEDQIPF